jgi:hypothetical protein
LRIARNRLLSCSFPIVYGTLSRSSFQPNNSIRASAFARFAFLL